MNQPMTVRALLFGDDTRGEAALDQALRERGLLGGALTRLSAAGQAAAGRQVAGAANGLLQLDLVDLLAAGWRAHTALQAAARATAANPGSTQIVELTTHRIGSTHEPYLDVVVNEHRLARLQFRLQVDFEVHGLLATVWQGNLVGVQCGRCRAVVALSCEGAELARREAEIDAPLVVRLREAIPLLPTPVPAPGPGPTIMS